MNYKMILVTILVLAAVAAWAVSTHRKQNFKTVSVAEFAEIIKDTAAVLLLDVRSADEYSQGHIAGALQIDYHSAHFMDCATTKLSKERPVAIYCRSGRRSTAAAEKLAKEGYTLINLEGGILAWQSNGLAVESNQTQSSNLKTEIEKRVKDIYDEIFSWYLAHMDDLSNKNFNRPEVFSKNYWQIFSAVQRKDTESDELGFFDYDHWIQAQDWDTDLAMHIDSVEVKDNCHALVNSHITNCGNQSPLLIAMVLENGTWLIDDFITPDHANRSEKSEMKLYLKQDKQ